MTMHQQDTHVSHKVHIDKDNRVHVHCKLHEHVKDSSLFYIAASPPEFKASFSGSGLPFASPSQAFDNTPNKGYATVDAMNTANITIYYPNAYYSGMGSTYVPPTLYLTYHNGFVEKVVSIKLSHGIPYRMLTYPLLPTRKDAMFYAGMWELPVRSQEQILRDSAYPDVNKMYCNHWGLKPPT